MARSQRPPQTSASSQGSRNQAFAYGLTYTDAERIRALIPHAEHVVRIRETPQSLRRGFLWANSIVVGTDPDYLKVMRLKMASGRWLSPLDSDQRQNAAVLGAQLAATLFPVSNPIGESVQAGNTRFTVVGLLENMGRSASPGGMALDQCIFVPLTTSRARYGDEIRRRSTGSSERTRIELHEIKLKMSSTNDVVPTSLLLSNLLDIGIRPQDDVKMIVPLEQLRQQEATARIFNIVLGSIAFISLLVGGIGIMNVMLATVTERTREIGIRRALGARRSNIIKQFLIETVVLSGCGGILGLALGLIVPFAITQFSGNLTIVRLEHVMLAFCISTAVGVAFGIYPAWRAANMDPVDALRHS
jgi:putative ABC transport system permease protein